MASLLRRTLYALPLLVSSLACGGLFGDERDAALRREAALDAEDEAEVARLKADFEHAEAILGRRLEADPNDPRSWRLLGDVNLTRGQRFQARWKENLGRAVDDYVRSVELDPTSCLTWGRLAAVVIASAENEATAVPRDRLDALPLDVGWESCAGPALLEIELRRLPDDATLAAARRPLPGDASEIDVLAAAAPWMVEAVKRVDLSGVDWRPVLARADVAPGAHFVVLDTPVTAQSVEGSKPRNFTYPEWLQVRRLSSGRIVYLDRRFPERIPSRGLTRATGCPGTEWRLEGPDKVAIGTCVAGPQDRRASEVFDPDKLRPAGAAHFHHPSIAPATLDWVDIADDSVNCLGGPVGRMFVDVPSCQVAYDRAIPQQRSIPAESGLVAVSEDHAKRMVATARGAALYGEEAARRLSRGEVGAGLPYGLFSVAQPDLTGCKGRGLFTKLQIADGALEFECTLGEVRYEFRELTLIDVTIGAAAGG